MGIFDWFLGKKEEKIYGCTDPLADNYDPSATDDDSSCVYYGDNESDSIKDNLNLKKSKQKTSKPKKEVKKYENRTCTFEKKGPLNLEDKIYTFPEFASRIREKFVDYQDVPDKLLVELILKKFPIYSDNISNEEVDQSDEDKKRELKGKEHPLLLSESNQILIKELFIESQENMESEDYSNAINALSKIIEIVENNRNLSNLDPKPIIRYHLENSYKFDIVDLYYIRGCAKFASEDEDALNDFNSALAINPDYTEALYNRSIFYNNINNDHERALNDIEKCLSLKPYDEDFVKFHKMLLNENGVKLSELEFLSLAAIYFVSCYEFSILKYLEHEDSLSEQKILMDFLTQKFNNYFNFKEGVIWDKLLPLVEKLKSDGVLNEEEFFPIAVALPKYDKNQIIDLLIEITCSSGEIKRSEIMMQIRFCQILNPKFDEVPLRQKWENKIGIFPDVREWDENEPIKLDG